MEKNKYILVRITIYLNFYGLFFLGFNFFLEIILNFKCTWWHRAILVPTSYEWPSDRQ